MKKHLAGFALYNLIVIVTVAAYAYFAGVPAYLQPEPTSCWTHLQNADKPLTFEVLGVQYDLDRKILLSRITVRWNGFGAPPRSLYVTHRTGTVEGPANTRYSSDNIVRAAFQGDRFAIIELETELEAMPLDPSANYYSEFAVSHMPNLRHGAAVAFSEPSQVLFSHGSRSMK